MAPIREEKKNEKNEKQINVFLITSGEIRNSIRILLGQWIVDIVEFRYLTLCFRLTPSEFFFHTINGRGYLRIW